MRSIKLRFYDPKEKYMVKPIELFEMMRDCKNINSFDNLIAMKYMGFQDKNGIDIYEGDIIKSFQRGFFLSEPKKEHIYKIEFSETLKRVIGNTSDGFGWKDLIAFLDGDCEIIGNIHQHPELLEISNENSSPLS